MRFECHLALTVSAEDSCEAAEIVRNFMQDIFGPELRAARPEALLDWRGTKIKMTGDGEDSHG